MRRTAERALCAASIALLLVAALGCDQLDGRSRNRKGNRLFNDRHFAAAAAEYERALTEVKSPIIDYNLGLTYSKLFHPGDEPQAEVVLDRVGSLACQAIPNTKTIDRQACVKPKNWDFMPCDAKNVCPSSYKCERVQLCTSQNAAIADLSAAHFQKWLAAHPKDNETRGLMTQVWLDSSQFQKALDYWTKLQQQNPNDPAIMGSLAGINLKAGNWRASIDWYLKVAAISSEPAAKASAYQFIGNVAWAKLSSKSLTRAESIELADRGIAALQAAAALEPDNPGPVGLQAAIFNFRSLAHGASWAGAIDRATAQDLLKAAHVLYDKAKKAQEQATPKAPAPAGASTPKPAKAGG